MSLKRTPKGCSRYGLLQRHIRYFLVIQCAFKLYKSQISLIDMLESGDAYFLNQHLDIKVDIFLYDNFSMICTQVSVRLIPAAAAIIASSIPMRSHFTSALKLLE